MNSDKDFSSTPSALVTCAGTITGSISSELEARPALAGGAPFADSDPYAKSNLTATQLQVWLAQNLLPETPVFNLPVGFHLDGPIVVEWFQDAFSVLVDSSDALRTTVEESSGIPLQRVLPQVSSELERVDFSGSLDPLAEAQSWMESRCATPLNWRGRLFDSALIRLAEDRFIWYFNAHHLICDGWSFELIYRRMADLYHCAREGRLPKKIALPPYANYLDYERAHRQSARFRKTEAYWKEFLAQVRESVSFYGKLPVTKTTRVRRVSHELGAERTKQLKAIASTMGGGTREAALFDIFAAVLIGYLHCLNGQHSYTIGVPFHNRRSKSDFDETIGFFSEVLPVRVAIAEDETFATLVKKFNREIHRTLRHGQYPVTNPVFNRVYEVTLNLHTRSFSDFAGIPAQPAWVHNGHGDESLGVQVHDFKDAGNLVVDFDLHEAVFDERDGERVVTHLMRVLDAFLADREQPLRRLSLASQEETRDMLAQVSAPVPEISAWRPVHTTFEMRAKEQPHHPAVLSADGSLTYSELDRRANRISRVLAARGIKPETPVVIYLTRSPDTIAAILGVLKSGAAYVPVDPQYSGEWLEFILEDTGAQLVLTERKLIAQLRECRAASICLDELDWESDVVDQPCVQVSGDNLAYIIYTSGSTGTPKGVEITHRALANFAREASRTFELSPCDRILQFASISFDTSVEEIFPCLTSGASLVLCGGLESAPGAGFLELCRAWQVTVLDLPTAYWHELTAAFCAEKLVIPEPIRLVVIGGERAIPERVALWQAFVGGKARLINTYGPTEATVAATVADLTSVPAECGAATEVPIGRPIANARALVLDRNLNLVPEGVPGELYIGGSGLARGYVGRPELTAEKFIPNPFDGASGSRLYRTGDIARYRDDGNLEFLRRRDDQVKVRGFRVELEGVAAVLRQHPLVREAAVLQEPVSSRGRLVAYIVPEGAAVLHLKDLQNFVRARLPEYMVPAAVVAIDSLPLTRRGKLDRAALRLAQNSQSGNAETLVPAQTQVEERIAGIWRELLSLQQVGRNQHFFELGGHSLLAAQAVSRIRREFGVEVPLRVIFESPTIAMLGEHIEQVLDHPVRLEEATPIPFGSHNGHAPASDSQSRIWYMDQFAPESSAYNVTAAIRFTGKLDHTALQKSVNDLIEKHESLRTSIENDGGQPVQVIARTLQLELPELSLRTTPAEEKIDRAKQILREAGRRPFDLSRGPLIRLLLLELDQDDYVLLLSMHHLISDQWSMSVIAREVSAAYNAYRNAAAPPLMPPGAQYGDFAVWQRRRLTAERLQEEMAYWTRQLGGMQPAAVPTDRPRPAVQTFRGAHQTLALSSGLIDKLRRLALDENATLYMVFLAAFKILLSRYTGREDIALGSPVANRMRAEWENVIGTFINILVLRTDLSGNPSLREIVRRVRTVVLDAFTHQEMPFERLVEELAPGRDASRSPLVQILFNFQNTPVGNIDFDGISWAPFELDQWSSQFDLSVTVDPEITRKIFLSYNTDLYDAATVDRILRSYAEILEALAANAEQYFAGLSLLIAGEDQSREDNQLVYPQQCLHELFEAQAARTPDAVALSYENRQLTYQQLNELANRLARRLRKNGVRPEVLVGICAERSPELVAGLLAILKAGGAYVPIDPAYPSERIAFILKDSGVAALLTQRSLLAQLPLPETKLPILCLDDQIPESEEPGTATSLDKIAGPDHVAYVIYTSGSTGQPKGVQIAHRALVSFLHSMKERPAIGSDDVLLSVTTISFDIAALELFLPLTCGARVVMVSRETAADGKALVSQLAASGASVMQATPTTWRMLIDAGWQGEAKNFKIICGGESLPLKLAQELLARSGSVWNLYGPTETTVWSAIWPVTPGCDKIAIGRPIHNTQIHILDASLQPMPVGMVGEVYIGGEGLARGYLNRPELTAEKFLPNPFGQPSSRLYRTGDLGRRWPDGNVEFIGRVDNQVKIRGFRIELGEIEAVLCGHEDVKEAVVAVREGDQLAGYVVARPGRLADVSELRDYLRQKLPAYMVPAALMSLDNLPLTPNGKINRRALPSPEISARMSDGVPTERLEFEVANIWKRLLHLKTLGLHDNFFDLGGNSLLATRLLAAIESDLGKRIRLGEFFACPTIAHVAELLRRDGYAPQWSSLVPIQSLGSKPPFFWVHGLTTNVRLPGYLGADQPLYALVPQSQDGKPAVYTEIEQMAAHYVEELRSVQPEGPYFLGGYSFGGLLVFEVAQQLMTLGERVALLALLDGTAPFKNIGSGVQGSSVLACKPTALLGFGRARVLGKLCEHFSPPRGWTDCVYFARKIGAKIYRRLRIKSLKKTAKRIAYQFFISIDRAIPVICRETYIADLHRNARRNYRPISYPGPVLFFQALGNPADPLSTWQNLFDGEVDIYPIPGNHQTIAQEPQFKLWAEKLRDFLNKTQAAVAPGNHSLVDQANGTQRGSAFGSEHTWLERGARNDGRV